MNIVVAADSFKGTLTSREAGNAIADGIHRVLPDARVMVLPVADGGEGTVEAFLEARGGTRRCVTVMGPLGEPVGAEFAILAGGKQAVLEMAAASGITLLESDRRDPLRTTTYGTGQIIGAALDAGCGEILIGVGGSATVDGGCGAAQALGVCFLDATDRALQPGIGGGQLDRIERIDLADRDLRVAGSEIAVLCDVANPLCGAKGAARTFGPQKGASPEQVSLLDENLRHLADVILRDMGMDVRDRPGAGAAGGLAAGLMAFCGATLVPGIGAVLDAVNLDQHLREADLVVTGEGRLDAQSMMGKVVAGVAARARSAGVRVVAIAGSVGAGAERCREMLDAYYAVFESPPANLPTAAEAADRLRQRTAEVFATEYT
jgi:glycerate kinase